MRTSVCVHTCTLFILCSTNVLPEILKWKGRHQISLSWHWDKCLLFYLINPLLFPSLGNLNILSQGGGWCWLELSTLTIYSLLVCHLYSFTCTVQLLSFSLFLFLFFFCKYLVNYFNYIYTVSWMWIQMKFLTFLFLSLSLSAMDGRILSSGIPICNMILCSCEFIFIS